MQSNQHHWSRLAAAAPDYSREVLLNPCPAWPAAASPLVFFLLKVWVGGETLITLLTANCFCSSTLIHICCTSWLRVSSHSSLLSFHTCPGLAVTLPYPASQINPRNHTHSIITYIYTTGGGHNGVRALSRLSPCVAVTSLDTHDVRNHSISLL